MIDCCCVDVDEGVDFDCHAVRKARKAYQCDECNEAIRPGERYEYTSTLYDGDWSCFRTCLPCVGIRRDFFGCGFYYGRMREDFRECQGWDYVTGERVRG